MRWTRHAAGMRAKMNACGVLVGKPGRIETARKTKTTVRE
jgi:hypothetical protein